MILNLKYIQSISGVLGIAFVSLGTVPHWAMAQTDSQIAAITKATKFDDVREVRSLIDKGMSPNQKDPRGMPILMVAIQENSTKTAAKSWAFFPGARSLCRTFASPGVLSSRSRTFHR